VRVQNSGRNVKAKEEKEQVAWSYCKLHVPDLTTAVSDKGTCGTEYVPHLATE
jgi:hypothetical protein